jgi:hypothetical protein
MGQRPRPQAGVEVRVQHESAVVDHRHHGVQVHHRAAGRQFHRDHRGHATGGEQRLGQHLHCHRRGPLTHADHHRAVAEHMHVAALDAGRQVRGIVVAVVPGETLVGEHRMEPVDGPAVQRLALARGLGHRVHRDTRVHPAGGVPLVQVIRQRRQHEVVRVLDVPAEAVRGCSGEVRLEYPADEQLGELRPGHAVEHLAHRFGQGGAELAGGADAVEDERAAFWDVESLREQVGEVMHLHAPVAEHLGERVVLLLGPLGPQDVVEQQLRGVPRGEPGQFQPGPVHNNLAEPADLRLHTEFHISEHYASETRCPPAAALSGRGHVLSADLPR